MYRALAEGTGRSYGFVHRLARIGGTDDRGVGVYSSAQRPANTCSGRWQENRIKQTKRLSISGFNSFHRCVFRLQDAGCQQVANTEGRSMARDHVNGFRAKINAPGVMKIPVVAHSKEASANDALTSQRELWLRTDPRGEAYTN